jgi:hypothetical protein
MNVRTVAHFPLRNSYESFQLADERTVTRAGYMVVRCIRNADKSVNTELEYIVLQIFAHYLHGRAC